MKNTFVFLASFAASLAVCACGGKNAEEQVTEVPVITIRDTSYVYEYSFPAKLRGIQDVAIFPQVQGRIVAIKIKEGDFVEAGQVLFEIDEVSYRAAYDAAVASREVAKSQVASAELTLESKRNLLTQNVISEYQYKLAQNSLMTAQAKLAEAEAAVQNTGNELSFTKVHSLVSGRVGALPYKLGSLVSPSILEPLTTISDNSSVYADFSITESEYLNMNAAQILDNMNEKKIKVQMLMGNGERYGKEGYVSSMDGLLSATTSALPVRAVFPNPDRLLLSGGACHVILPKELEHIIIVPRTSIKEIQNKMFVFKVIDGTLEQTEILAYRLNPSEWVLLPDEDGNTPLVPGDVVTSTTNRLKNHDKVVIRQ